MQRENTVKKSRTKRGCDSFKNLDAYGEPVSFTFENKSKYQTVLGSIITILCATLFFSFFVVQTNKMIAQDDPFFSMTTVALEDQVVDLWQLGFMFAVEDIDPRIGRLEAEYTRWS